MRRNGKAVSARMERQRVVVVVVVEEAEASRTALRWAVGNLIRDGDSITLLHVCAATRSKRKQRGLRRLGFQLALSFRDLCNGIAEAKVEIIVTEGDQWASVASTVGKVRASYLIVGLHHRSFLYKTSIPDNCGLGCRIFAVKQHPTTRDGFISLDYSQIEITDLRSELRNPTPLFRLCLGMTWRRPRRRK